MSEETSWDLLQEDYRALTEKQNAIISRQGALYKDGLSRNDALQKEVLKLQEELEAWKMVFNSMKQEKETLEKKAARDQDQLQVRLNQLDRELATKNDSALIVCLIDGDGAVFAESFLSRGKEGGRDAATKLNKVIMDYIDTCNRAGSSENEDSLTETAASTRPINSPQLMCTVYFNRFGLCRTLLANGVCSPQNYWEFFAGFNQAAPLFTLVDVGDWKEAADAKLRESLKLYARLPQTRKLFFGGAHDSGYLSTLGALRTEGHLGKVVVLTGYAKMAKQFRKFVADTKTEVVSVPDLFLQKKLNVAAGDAKALPTPDPGEAGIPQKPTKNHGSSGVTATETPKHPTPDKRIQSQTGPSQAATKRYPNLRQSLMRQNPPLCNAFYLRGSCNREAHCSFSHDYVLSAGQVEQYRQEISQVPCSTLINSGRCNNALCPFRHKCNYGLGCHKRTQACKFLHDDALGVKGVARGETPLSMAGPSPNLSAAPDSPTASVISIN